MLERYNKSTRRKTVFKSNVEPRISNLIWWKQWGKLNKLLKKREMMSKYFTVNSILSKQMKMLPNTFIIFTFDFSSICWLSGNLLSGFLSNASKS